MLKRRGPPCFGISEYVCEALYILGVDRIDHSNSGGYVGNNFKAVVDHLPLSADELRTMACDVFLAGFMDDDERARCLTHFDEICAAYGRIVHRPCRFCMQSSVLMHGFCARGQACVRWRLRPSP